MQDILVKLRKGEELRLKQQLELIVQLSVPAIMAQISTIVMQYIDASMVGRLGAKDSASIGLVASSTWLIGGLCSALVTGFTVQVAQSVGANNERRAKDTIQTGIVTALAFSLILCVIASLLSEKLPYFLGGNAEIIQGASKYFLVYALALPVMQLNNTAGGMLQGIGNMKIPSILHILMCILDVIFNAILIFPSKTIQWGTLRIFVPGAGLGITGAALGTMWAEAVSMFLMIFFLRRETGRLFGTPNHTNKSVRTKLFHRDIFCSTFRISLPIGCEQTIMCGAYIMATKIVAPLGTVAIAANSFSVTAEGLCYMPGYGIAAAATTMIGQSVGAGRRDLTKRLGWITTIVGILVMTISGALMYLLAPVMIGLLTQDPQIRELGTEVLRIEAFAEPMYGASIIATGVFRGMGDTLTPSILSFISMWLVRIPLSAILAPRYGLKGVWVAMCMELCIRGILFLGCLAKKVLK